MPPNQRLRCACQKNAVILRFSTLLLVRSSPARHSVMSLGSKAPCTPSKSTS